METDRTAQPKGTTAKPSGTQENLDSSRPIGKTDRKRKVAASYKINIKINVSK